MRTGFVDIVCCSSSFKNDAMYDVPICSNFFCERQIHWTLPHFVCARIDLLFTIFVCSHYRPLLHHFGFVMCVNFRLYCMHFSCHWRKIRNVSCRLTQISKRQPTPATAGRGGSQVLLYSSRQFSAHPESSLAHIDERAAQAARNTCYRYNQIGSQDRKMADNCVSFGPHKYSFLYNN